MWSWGAPRSAFQRKRSKARVQLFGQNSPCLDIRRFHPTKEAFGCPRQVSKRRGTSIESSNSIREAMKPELRNPNSPAVSLDQNCVRNQGVANSYGQLQAGS